MISHGLTLDDPATAATWTALLQRLEQPSNSTAQITTEGDHIAEAADRGYEAASNGSEEDSGTSTSFHPLGVALEDLVSLVVHLSPHYMDPALRGLQMGWLGAVVDALAAEPEEAKPQAQGEDTAAPQEALYQVCTTAECRDWIVDCDPKTPIVMG